MIKRLYFFRCKINNKDSFGKPFVSYETGIETYKSFFQDPNSAIKEIKQDLSEDYDTAENNVEMITFCKL